MLRSLCFHLINKSLYWFEKTQKMTTTPPSTPDPRHPPAPPTKNNYPHHWPTNTCKKFVMHKNTWQNEGHYWRWPMPVHLSTITWGKRYERGRERGVHPPCWCLSPPRHSARPPPPSPRPSCPHPPRPSGPAPMPGGGLQQVARRQSESVASENGCQHHQNLSIYAANSTAF